MIRSCLVCQKDFYTKPARVKVGKGKYCSTECYHGKRINKICLAPDCKREYSVPPCFEDRKYCSKKCSNKYKRRVGHLGYKHSEETKQIIRAKKLGVSLSTKGKPKLKMRGELHPNWKGGISTPNKLERARFRITMQKLVFERDNYTCQMCGSITDLQVDHIQNWKDYIELRFEMSNLRTLCMDCHYLITYGRPKPKDIVWGHNLMKARILKFL